MRKVAVVGTGHTDFAAESPKTEIEMFCEAATEAMAECETGPEKIQALYCGNVFGDFAEGQGMIQSYIANELGMHNIPATRFEGACASATLAIRDAFMWVASGFYDIVLVGGTEKATAMSTPLATRTFAMGTDAKYEFAAGLTFPGFFALLAHLYAHTYGVSMERLREQMSLVSVQSHFYGTKNPHAQFKHKEITVDQVSNGFMVASPLRLLDCCPFSDGAAALVLASEDVAKKLTAKPVFITGSGQASSPRLSAQAPYLPRLRAREISAKQAYDMAGIGPADIDICELHDCFSIASIIAAENLGFAENGTAGQLWEKGETKIGGKIPINISGGLKAKGHPIGATGASQTCEIVRQLRGDLVDSGRQVNGAKTGLVDTLGGDGTIANLVLQAGW
ncbi:acetyl-CoA C-acetyltransferase/acetyl-CoA acyltransferase [Desulfosalsimonas propionicica]|uniref:Acetyl-CoA C-acetyltransferase/acetyl-CoA acyltransferase n=1 Tax=Desulfosalsimonas propionicica TaxID=332175 RepID=A0A7W0CBC4_9BACT|nr:propanoyl-CoA acyltransferase [Desulfosalsimonas propionicica]MBA2882522.1 acetyl-CoA C-acetyltransferase/acetyl-CoA acyltransferase [Desulfosalsimonas propionicica]